MVQVARSILDKNKAASKSLEQVVIRGDPLIHDHVNSLMQVG